MPHLPRRAANNAAPRTRLYQPFPQLPINRQAVGAIHQKSVPDQRVNRNVHVVVNPVCKY